MTVEYEKKGDQYILTKGDKVKRLPRQAVEAVMFSMNCSEKEAVEYQAKHVMPESSFTPPVPTPPPKPKPTSPQEPEPEPEDEEEEDEAGKDAIDEILESYEGEDEEEEVDEEDEDLEDEEEEEDFTEEKRAELIKELKKGMKSEKRWNNYKWLMSIAGDLDYFDGPGTPKKDKATIQKWLKKQTS